jgi:hypothetical protein
MKLRSLEADIDRRWSVANQNNKAWRQISIAPDSDYVIDRDAFLRLLPEAALTEEEHAHRFPFTEVNGRPVYGFVDQSWQGAIPNTPEEPPSYLWRLQRDGGFAYRERLWEVDQILDPPYGHVILGSLFDIAVPALAFYSRVARVWQPRMDLLISMELHGIRNRGIAFDLGSDRPSFGDFAVDEPRRVSMEDGMRAEIHSPIPTTIGEVVKASISIVGELILPLRPESARDDVLTAQLNIRREREKQARTPYPRLGVLAKLSP